MHRLFGFLILLVAGCSGDLRVDIKWNTGGRVWVPPYGTVEFRAFEGGAYEGLFAKAVEEKVKGYFTEEVGGRRVRIVDKDPKAYPVYVSGETPRGSFPGGVGWPSKAVVFFGALEGSVQDGLYQRYERIVANYIAHEIGHKLGVPHSQVAGKIMSYASDFSKELKWEIP